MSNFVYTGPAVDINNVLNNYDKPIFYAVSSMDTGLMTKSIMLFDDYDKAVKMQEKLQDVVETNGKSKDLIKLIRDPKNSDIAPFLSSAYTFGLDHYDKEVNKYGLSPEETMIMALKANLPVLEASNYNFDEQVAAMDREFTKGISLKEFMERSITPKSARLAEFDSEYYIMRYEGILADGVPFSVQASSGHWSTPKNNKGPYEKVELHCVNNLESGKLTGTSMDSYSYNGVEWVNYPFTEISIAEEYVKNHGGVVAEIRENNQIVLYPEVKDLTPGEVKRKMEEQLENSINKVELNLDNYLIIKEGIDPDRFKFRYQGFNTMTQIYTNFNLYDSSNWDADVKNWKEQHPTDFRIRFGHLEEHDEFDSADGFDWSEDNEEDHDR